MTSHGVAPPPSVLWAQRNSFILLTFSAECDKPDIKIEKQLVTFKGECAPDQKLHEVNISLYAEIDPEKSTVVNKGRYIEAILTKVNQNAPFWPNLTSDQKKHHWLKVDFNKWVDEDESEDDLQDDMFSSRMGDFGDNEDDNPKDDFSSEEEDDMPDLN